MRRLGLVVSFSLVFAAFGCGSSGGGGAGGSGGATGTGGAGATGGTMGAGGGAAGATGSGGTNGGAGNGGAGGALAVCGDATGVGETCSTIVGAATGPCVVTMMSSGTAPTPAGGSISNGTYEMTSSTFYGTLPDAGNGQDSGDLSTRRETFVVTGASASSFTLEQFRVDGAQIESEEGTVSVSGTMVTYAPSCPPPHDGGNNGGSAGFTATATTFTLIISENGGTLVRVYTKS